MDDCPRDERGTGRYAHCLRCVCFLTDIIGGIIVASFVVDELRRIVREVVKQFL